MQKFASPTDGHALAYWLNGSGPPVVLLHGIPTNAHLWRDVVGPIVKAGHSVLTVDLLGYGASDKPADVDLGILAQAARVGELLTALGLARPIIAGHDIGGGVALLLALAGKASQLVLVDSILYDSFPEPGIARLKEPVWDGILGAEDFDLRRGFGKGLSRGIVDQALVTPDLIGAYAGPFEGVEGRRAYLRAARALRTEELSTRMAEAESLPVPILLIWGRADIFQPLSFAERFVDANPKARLEIVEHGGHFLPEDDPAEVARLIIAAARN